MKRVVLLGLLCCACYTPTAPTTATPDPRLPFKVQTYAMETHAPVLARIELSDDEHEVTAIATGFRTRQQRTAPEILLWENDDTTDDLVYGWIGALIRPEGIELRVHDGAGLGGVLQDVAQSIAEESPYRIVLSDVSAPIRVLRSWDWWAWTDLHMRGYTIVGATIRIDPRGYPGPHLFKALKHELTHVMGLSECRRNDGIMCSREPLRSYADYERVALWKSRLREPGNRPPDTAP